MIKGGYMNYLVFYNLKENELYLGEILHEELSHILLTKNDEEWVSSLLLEGQDFVFVGFL